MRMPALLKLATILGATPLVLGTLIFLTWLLTRWEALEFAGLLTIFCGLIAFVAGSLALVSHLWRERRIEKTTRGPLSLQALLAGGLLLSNFPAAALIVHSADRVKSRHIVTVQNDSDEMIESFILTGPDVSRELGPIDSRKASQTSFNLEREGALEFTACQHNKPFHGQVNGYVGADFGSTNSVRVLPGGQFEVKTDFNR